MSSLFIRYRKLSRDYIENVVGRDVFYRRFNYYFDVDHGSVPGGHNLATGDYEVVQWVREQFGECDRQRWEHGGFCFAFRDEIDATAFRLRWC